MDIKFFDKSNDDICLRAAPATYFILCGMWLALGLMGLFVWAKTNQGALLFVLPILVMVLFGTWLRFFHLRLSKTHFFYRSMLGGRVSFDRSKIFRARVVSGYHSLSETTKPFVRLEIDGVTDKGLKRTVSVNIRVFDRNIATVIKEISKMKGVSPRI